MKKFLTTLLLASLFIVVYKSKLEAQTIITGKVVDSETSSPMSYASIRIKEKALGVVANEQGEFTLSLNSSPETYTLVISFIGFKTYEIQLAEFSKRQDKTIKLEPNATELDEVKISGEKFDVNKFMEKVIEAYQSGARTTSHIAQAYFQEQVSIKFKPVMFADGIGYSVYLGDAGNMAARSNYKFFYEQVSVNQNYKPWIDHLSKLGKTKDHRFGASDNLNNFRTFELNGPLSGNGKKFKYTLGLDSTYAHKGQAYLLIRFKGSNQSGWMVVGEENLHVWGVAYNASENVWSSAYDDRIEGLFTCIYDYYEDQHYLSETTSYYRKGDVTHWNKLKIVSQKFDKLELSEKEYWAINSFDRFTIGQVKENEMTFKPYNFSKKDSTLRAEFTEGFKGLIVDNENNAEYKALLAKLRAFF